MSRKDLSKRDASDYASSELSYVIRSQKRTVDPSVPSVSVEEAMRDERMVEISSSRDVTRVLFVSQNTELLNPSQQSLDGYLELSDLFDEVHILILREGIPAQKPVIRVSENVWIYTATTRYWWRIPVIGVEMAESQMQFAGGFRADLIVSLDPFESALVASKLAKKYSKHSQLHITEDYNRPDFYKDNKRNYWRRFLPNLTISKFYSVRTHTDDFRRYLNKKFNIPDLKVLPQYQDYDNLMDSSVKVKLKDKYKPIIVFMLYVGSLNDDSNLKMVLEATSELLRNPRVGLIVIGRGERKQEFEKRAKVLGIDKQVIFISRVKDILPYLKTANILLVGDTDLDSERLVLQAAAAGIPMVMSETEKRSDLFIDGKSAFVCQKENSLIFGLRVKELLNSMSLRKMFIKESQAMISENFHDKLGEYQAAYRSSIEEALFADTKTVNETE